MFVINDIISRSLSSDIDNKGVGSSGFVNFEFRILFCIGNCLKNSAVFENNRKSSEHSGCQNRVLLTVSLYELVVVTGQLASVMPVYISPAGNADLSVYGQQVGGMTAVCTAPPLLAW